MSTKPDRQMFRRLVKVLSDATDPSLQLNLAERRKLMAAGIADAIEADVWIWTTGKINDRLAGDAMVTSYIDAGLKNESERADFYRIIIHPELAPIVVEPLYNAVRKCQSTTLRRCDLIPDAKWHTLPVSSLWKSLGFDDFLMSLVPLNHATYSSIGFHRRLGSPRFSQEECDLVNAAFPSIGWLHSTKLSDSMASRVTALSPRERQVFMLLLKGATRKEIALQLNLSTHTITDYIKEVYRKFEVTSRGELLTTFLS